MRVTVAVVAAAAILGALLLPDKAAASEQGKIRLAQAVVVPDGKYSSITDFLAGTWVWERASPRQTVQMRFSRNKTFFFHNLTLGLTHYGNFDLTKGGFRLTIHRTCTNNGQRCSNRNPPLVLTYPLKPTKANEFYSESERWNRIARE